MELQTALRILRRHYRSMLLCVVLVTVVAYVSAISQEKQYSATASLLFQDPGYDRILFNSAAPATDPTRDAATDLTLASLETVAARTANAIGERLTAAQVGEKLSVSAQGLSDTVSVVATDPDPQFAARLATTYAQQFIAFRRNADRADLLTAQQVVQQQLAALPTRQRDGSTGAALRNRADELEVLASLQTGNAELVQPATVPTSPSSPAPKRTAAVGLALGLILAILVAVLRERLDRRIREVDEIDEIFARPVLGSIPESTALRVDERDPWRLPAREREAFMLLSTNLSYFEGNRRIHTVLITSAAPGDGKTTIARNLAAATALSGENVLLIEADLRHPVLAGVLGLPGPRGLSDVLAGRVTWPDALVPIAISRGDRLDPVQFDLMVAGRTPPNPTDLIRSERMQNLLTEVAGNYRLVLIDTPPVAIVSDAIPLMSQVDGVIVVTRINKSTRDSLRHLKRQLDSLAAPLLGVVINGLTFAAGYYGYAYEADAGDSAMPADPSAAATVAKS